MSQLQEGDILSALEARAIERWQELHNMVSELVESGKIKEADLPDDYRALVRKLEQCVQAENKADWENDHD